MTADAQDLFRSRDLRAFRVGAHGSACCVVTFDAYTDHRTLDRPGFGQHFLARHGIDAIHVVTRDNEWYQHPELRPALEAVRAVATGYERVVAYGSSMGAYAALRFGAWAGAGCALALSPQFSIDPAVMRRERRWAAASARFRAVWEGQAAFATPPEAYVAFDPLDQDRAHVARLARACRFTPMPLPGAGHPVTGFLAELGLLQRLLLGACGHGLDPHGLDPEALVAEALRRREESPQWFIVQATRTRSVPRQIALLRRALLLAPRHTVALNRMGVAMTRAGRHDEARLHHDQVLANEPGQPLYLLHYSQSLERAGDLVGALRLMEEAAARAADTPAYVARVAALRSRLARWRWLKAWLPG